MTTESTRLEEALCRTRRGYRSTKEKNVLKNDSHSNALYKRNKQNSKTKKGTQLLTVV
jgi:hypothetical protein